MNPGMLDPSSMWLQLASLHMAGIGGKEANCSKAASFVQVVLQERRGWSEDIAVAVEALDDGEPAVCHLLCPTTLPVVY